MKYLVLAIALAGCSALDIEKDAPPVIPEVESVQVEPQRTPEPRRECYNEGEHTECCLTDRPTSCADISFGDGRGGLLYKLGDHSGEPVLLLPGECGRVQSVKLCGNGQCLDGRDSGFSNPDAGGICRHHWRWDTKASRIARQIGQNPRIEVNGRSVERLSKGTSTRHD